ncbi:hypothetical protein PR202_ga29151 [Eleusine coracana subsp. coracana]|uniref:Uncharacterized protein n=1 Tax=Eleusine coracana subsp. coracana TaxID=191504 RepID=A0AAV5DIU7_ELECO|nr:hypothetical protein PR202_ga29151 [Eleusine coracana subsp. coracana]
MLSTLLLHRHLKIPNLLLRKFFVMRICKELRYLYLQTSRIHQQLSQRKNWLDTCILKS